MKIYVAGIPGAWSTQKLAEAFQRKGVESPVLSLSECSFDIRSGRVLWRGHDLRDGTGVVVRKLGDPIDPLCQHRLNILYQLQHCGLTVISRPEAIEEVNNRYRMTVKLAWGRVPIPETVVTESFDEAVKTVVLWGRAVLKPLFTSKGRGMVLLDREGPYQRLLRDWEGLGRFPYYLQRYVKTDYDTGIAILDGTIIGAFNRISSGTWQTTIREGGHYEPARLDEEMKRIALRAAAVFELAYTIVDMVRSEDGYLVYEVSAFGGFSGLNSCGIDVASVYSDYVISKLSRNRA